MSYKASIPPLVTIARGAGFPKKKTSLCNDDLRSTNTSLTGCTNPKAQTGAGYAKAYNHEIILLLQNRPKQNPK